jgi:ectoine hydroxylase-related dioxygenase (phytanoyl-CoA dioxygenase family)
MIVLSRPDEEEFEDMLQRLFGSKTPPSPSVQPISGQVTSVARAAVAGYVINSENAKKAVELEVFYGNGRSARIQSRIPSDAKDDSPLRQPFLFKLPKEHLEESEFDRVGVKPVGSDSFLEGSPLSEPTPQADRITTHYDAITEGFDFESGPPLDRSVVDEAALSANQRQWRERGYVRLAGVLDPSVLEAYSRDRAALDKATGWRSPAPFMHVASLMSLCCDGKLAALLEELVGEPMGVHLNLTGWVSTERNWHQDDYLSDPAVRGWRAGVWIALEDIDPRSGPFEFVPGSHRWPVMRRDKVRGLLPPAHRSRADWPTLTQEAVSKASIAEIERRGATVQRFIAKKGELLVWHPRLLHRGSPPEVPGLERRSIIAHYSSIHRRPDFSPARQTAEGGWYFPINLPLF